MEGSGSIQVCNTCIHVLGGRRLWQTLKPRAISTHGKVDILSKQHAQLIPVCPHVDLGVPCVLHDCLKMSTLVRLSDLTDCAALVPWVGCTMLPYLRVLRFGIKVLRVLSVIITRMTGLPTDHSGRLIRTCTKRKEFPALLLTNQRQEEMSVACLGQPHVLHAVLLTGDCQKAHVQRGPHSLENPP